MKTFLKIVGGLAVLVLLVTAGIKGYTSYKASQYEATAVPYVKMVVPELSKWDVDIIKGYMSKGSLNNTPNEKIIRIIDYLSKLGTLIRFDEPRFSQASSGTTREGEKQTVVTYTIDAVYENGDAVITLGLLDLGNSFQVNNFNINSMALAQ